VWTRWRVRVEDGARIDYRSAVTFSPTQVKVRLHPQDGAFRVARISGRARLVTPAVCGVAPGLAAKA